MISQSGYFIIFTYNYNLKRMDTSTIRTGLNTAKLTLEILNEKFVEWNHKWGQGRDDKGLRFGQWIHLYYRVPESDCANDGFYTEIPAEAYSELLTVLDQ